MPLSRLGVTLALSYCWLSSNRVSSLENLILKIISVIVKPTRAEKLKGHHSTDRFGQAGSVRKARYHAGSGSVSPRGSITHRPQSSSFWGLPYRILTMNPQKGTTLGPMGNPMEPGRLLRQEPQCGLAKGHDALHVRTPGESLNRCIVFAPFFEEGRASSLLLCQITA